MRRPLQTVAVAIFSLAATFAIASETRKPTTLADAVEAFNQKAEQNATGKAQLPLTEDEVIAAIFQWTNEHPKAAKAHYEAIQEIARTKMLPPNASLSFTARFENGKGRQFDVWWIDLTVDEKVEGSDGYTFRLRERWIRCLPSSRADD